MTLPPWEDFVKIEPNTQDMFGDFSCSNVPISSSGGGNPLPSILDDIGHQSHPHHQQQQQFTVPSSFHPSNTGMGGMQESNNPNQYRYSAFKMNYSHSQHFQRSYHQQPSSSPHLQMHESGMHRKYTECKLIIWHVWLIVHFFFLESPVSEVSRRTPPPPYYKGSPLEKRIQQEQSTPPPPLPLPTLAPAPSETNTKNTSSTSQSHQSTPKYNRRNNPDLEKRRIHHCDFPGK
jgi:hypothetical protein